MNDPPSPVHDWPASDIDQGLTEPTGSDPPPRRGRWLTPTSVVLVAVTVGFAGFFAGVHEEKPQATGSGSSHSVARARVAASASEASGSAFASPASLTSGTVSRVDGDTIYITESSGETVKVKLLAGTTISKSQSVSGRSVRPGDSVTVQGAG